MKKPYFFPGLFVVIMFACSPKLQLGGIRAPSNMNINASVSELPGGKFAAYSQDLRLDYTICNDDNYLYLIVRGKSGVSSSEHLFGAGLRFDIIPNDQKAGIINKSPEKVTVVYPQFPAAQIISIRKNTLKFAREHYRIDSTSRMSRKQLDSIIATANQKLTGITNRMKITGIPGQTDSVFAVTENPYLFKAVSKFDSDCRLVCEIAVPIKYIEQPSKSGNTFNYSLKLYGMMWRDKEPIPIWSKPFDHHTNLSPELIWSQSAHAFQGSYTLVK